MTFYWRGLSDHPISRNLTSVPDPYPTPSANWVTYLCHDDAAYGLTRFVFVYKLEYEQR
jgi:hypothetical protein